MCIKKTSLLISELRVIADSLPSEYIRNILNDAAERLEDTDKIAEFYWKQIKSKAHSRK